MITPYSMEQSPSWEANLFSASQEIPSILWNPKVHYSIHSRWPPITLYHILYLGISQLGHNSRFSSNWSCMCVSWSLSYSTLFQSDLLPHLQSLCSRVPVGGTWEHKGLQSGVQTVKVGNNLPCGVYYCKFLYFFPVCGEQSVNRGWLCTGEDVCQVCRHRLLLHHSTRVDCAEIVHTGVFNCNKATKWISGTTSLLTLQRGGF